MRKALIVIDYQNDFVADNGKLTCGKMAQEIEDNICQLIKEMNSTGGDVVFTFDTHDGFYNETKESENFPPHCIKGTDGWEPFGRVANYVRTGRRMFKNTFALPADQAGFLLDSYDELYLCGVATNVCVLQNAIVFYNMSTSDGYDTNFTVVENACASFDATEHEHSIAYMRDVLGFEVIEV